MKKKRMKNALIITFALLLVVGLSLVFFSSLFPLRYKALIKTYSAENNLDPAFVASLIKTESRFDKNAKSSKGALGLMQLMPSTASWIATSLLGYSKVDESDLFNPEVNIEIGTRYLRYLFEKYDDEVTVLACYNAGERVVCAWKEDSESLQKTQIKYKETLNYVEKVQNLRKIYDFRI